VCRWWAHCRDRWRTDDHLTLVAGLNRSHVSEIESWGVKTVAQLAALSMLVAAQAVPAPVGFERMVVAELQQRVLLRVGNEIDVSAVSAIAAARPALGDELLPAKGNAAMPAVSGPDGNLGFVDKHLLGTKTKPRIARK
jgi:hypothetical protein